MDDSPTRRLDDLPDEAGGPAEPRTRRLRRPPPPPDPNRCPECNGRMIPARTYTPSTNWGDRDLFLEPEGGSGLLGQHRTRCLALVCLTCGLTKFYAERPQNLLK